MTQLSDFSMPYGASTLRDKNATYFCVMGSATRLGDLLNFGQLLKAFGNN